MTNENGSAVVTLSSTAGTGNARIIATYNANADTVYVEFIEPYPAGQVDVTSSPAQISVGGDSTTITAKVFAENGQLIQDNTLVLFSTSNGTLSNLTGQTVSGEAKATLYAPNTTGTVTVTATAGSAQGQVDVEVTPGAVEVITLEADDDTLTANNSSVTNIVATVSDIFGNPVVQGTTIGFAAVGGTISESASVDATGHAIAQFRAGLTVGPAAITATNLDTHGSTTVYLTPSTPASVTLSITPQILAADGASEATLRAQVLDENTSPVSDGTEVVLTSQYGQIVQVVPVASRGGNRDGRLDGKFGSKTFKRSDYSSSTKGFSDSFNTTRFAQPTTSVLTVTTVNGYATAILVSATSATSDNITATAGDASDMKVAQYVAGEAASIQIDPGAMSLPADGVSSTTVTCSVVDAYGNPLGGGVAISVSSTLGSMSPSQGYTNSNGIFCLESQDGTSAGILCDNCLGKSSVRIPGSNLYRSNSEQRGDFLG